MNLSFVHFLEFCSCQHSCWFFCRPTQRRILFITGCRGSQKCLTYLLPLSPPSWQWCVVEHQHIQGHLSYQGPCQEILAWPAVTDPSCTKMKAGKPLSELLTKAPVPTSWSVLSLIYPPGLRQNGPEAAWIDAPLQFLHPLGWLWNARWGCLDERRLSCLRHYNW